jgi:C-terminal processing protease CtpA/Prc
MLRRLAAGLLLPCSLAVPLPATAADPDAATAPTRAQASEAQAQRMRGAANARAREGDPASLAQAAQEMEAVAAYLDSAEVRELGQGFFPLYIRMVDVKFDLARIYARQGRSSDALAALEDAQALAWMPAYGKMLAKEPAFALLRAEPRFQALLQTAALPAPLWQGPAADQPYRERLTLEERIAGLSLFWAEARTYFVHFDHVPELDWNKTYLDYLPKVMAAETTEDYYRVLMQLAPLLRDGHTNIYPPQQLINRLFVRPPVKTALVEGKVLVESVSSARLGQQLHPGDEIVSIDGIPVRRYAEERVAPFVSSSTPQDKLVRMYSYQLLLGAADAPLKLGLRDAAGREREETVARTGYDDVRAAPSFAFRMLPGEVAYIALDHFESDAGVKAFQAALPQIMAAKALVIDVRGNGGGSTSHGERILGYLSGDTIPRARSSWRNNSAATRSGGGDIIVWQRTFEFPRPPAPPHETFKGKVAVLTGPKTFSAAEDFVLAFNAMKRGITVGEATAGSTGQPMMFSLPGGGKARICAKRDVLPGGERFVGLGLAPGIEAHPTVQGIRGGADPVLERALAALRGDADRGAIQ